MRLTSVGGKRTESLIILPNKQHRAESCHNYIHSSSSIYLGFNILSDLPTL